MHAHRHSQMHTHMHSHMQSHMHSQMHSHEMQTSIEGVFWLVGALELVFVGGVVVVVAFQGSAFLGSAFLGSHSDHLLARLFSFTLIFRPCRGISGGQGRRVRRR